MRAPILLLALVTSLAPACTMQAPLPASPALPPDDACGAPGLQSLVGQPLSAFEALHRQGTTRVIRPGQPVTMDYSPTRLNVVLDDRDRIERISCG